MSMQLRFSQLGFFLFAVLAITFPDVVMAADPDEMLDDALAEWVKLLTEGWIRNALGLVIAGAGVMAWANVLPIKVLVLGTLGAFLVIGGVPLGTMIYDALN